MIYVMVLIIAVAALAGGYLAYRYLTPQKPCCAPEPARGQLFLKSYNFQTIGTKGTLFAVFGIFEGENVTLQQVYFDQTLLTGQNSGLNATCGFVKVANYTADDCTVSFSFGSSLPAPATGSTHTLRIVESIGSAFSFSVVAGYQYEATTTAAYPP